MLRFSKDLHGLDPVTTAASLGAVSPRNEFVRAVNRAWVAVARTLLVQSWAHWGTVLIALNDVAVTLLHTTAALFVALVPIGPFRYLAMDGALISGAGRLGMENRARYTTMCSGRGDASCAVLRSLGMAIAASLSACAPFAPKRNLAIDRASLS
jgi:hypothetical protein